MANSFQDAVEAAQQDASGQTSAPPAAEETSPFRRAVTAAQQALPAPRAIPTQIAEGQTPGYGTQAAISLATDPEQRRRIAAAQMFPGVPQEDALNRTFYAPDGRMAAIGADGKAFYVDPASPHLSFTARSPVSGKPIQVEIGGGGTGTRVGEPLKYAASSAGAAIPAVTGIAAASLAGPGSLVAGPALAAGGAAAGDVARQYGARYVDPATTPQPLNLAQTGTEAALSGGGQFGGALLSRYLMPNPLRLTPGDISTVRSGSVLPEARDAYSRASAQGVDLSPGQATGLPSLLQYEDAATTMPGTVDPATTFYRRQGGQLQAAGQNMLAAISPNADKTDAALLFSQGAEDAARSARQQANAAARPSYEAAQRAGQVMSPDLAQLADVPAVRTALDQAKTAYQNIYRSAAPDTPDFALWDLAKRKLDDAYTVATRAGERTDAMAIDNARQDLLTHLDTAYPTYGTARATAAPGQRLGTQLEDSGVGKAADAGIDERARAIVAPVFERNNPRAVEQARDAFASAGRSDEWLAGTRAYVQDAFDRASMSQQGLNPAMLRRQVWGNVDNRDNIRAALTPAQYEGFENFMRTVEDVARTYPINSLTATRLNARGALGGAAESQGNVRTLDTVATILSPFKWGEVGTAALGGVRQRMIQGNVGRIVGHLFTPDGLHYLEQMAQYAPGTQKAMAATGQLVTRAGSIMFAPPPMPDNSLAAPSP